MANFSVATNFDPELLTEIDRLNRQYANTIVEIYGSLPTSITGSGRSPRSLPQITKEELKEHIKLAHSYQLAFNYLLNAPNPKIAERDLIVKFDAEIDYLREIGVDIVTIADKTLIKQVKSNHPDLEVHASIILGVDTTQEAEELAEIGVSVITTNQFTINRNAKRLEELVKSVKDYNTKIRLYANISCLNHCPRATAHYTALGKSSREGRNENLNHDPFLIWCMGQYFDDSTNLLQSPFIRPEGIPLYASFGIVDFKLSDRREATSTLIELYKAYLGGEFHGNLYNLLFRNGRKWSNAIGKKIEGPSININNDFLTTLDFDKKVLTLEGKELREFYTKATGAAVKNVHSSESLGFRMRLESLTLGN